MDAWIPNQVDVTAFRDRRLGKRLARILDDFSKGIGSTLPLASQDWAGTKAAYRFLDNPRVDEEAILAGHFQATRSRFAASPGLALVLHDTTELSYQRGEIAPILVRTCVDRLAEHGDTTIAEQMDRRAARGVHRVVVRDQHGRSSTAKR